MMSQLNARLVMKHVLEVDLNAQLPVIVTMITKERKKKESPTTFTTILPDSH